MNVDQLNNQLQPPNRLFRGQKPLHALCCDSNIPRPELLIIMLRSGAKVNEADCRGQQALHYAVRRGSTQCVRCLLEFGAYLHLCDSGLRSPLHLAVQLSQPSITQLLLQNGAAADAPDLDGCQPLHYAASYVQPDNIRLLLNWGASAGARTMQGISPLGVVCKIKCALLSVNGSQILLRPALPPVLAQDFDKLLQQREISLCQVERCITLLLLGGLEEKLHWSLLVSDLSKLLAAGELGLAQCPTRSTPRLLDLARCACRQHLREHLASAVQLRCAVGLLRIPRLHRNLLLLEDV